MIIIHCNENFIFKLFLLLIFKFYLILFILFHFILIEEEIMISLLQFPKANKKLIMEKLRIHLQPVYNEFIQMYAPPKDTKDDIQILEYGKFKYVNKIILYFYLHA